MIEGLVVSCSKCKRIGKWANTDPRHSVTRMAVNAGWLVTDRRADKWICRECRRGDNDLRTDKPPGD